MTTQEALLAMKIGCKIRAGWMRKGIYYYIQGKAIHCSDDWSSFMSSEHFLQMFASSNDWSIHEC